MVTSKASGDLGELIAAKFISSLGYKIIDKNFRGKFGEIDIIAKYGNSLVFIEVKKRISSKFGTPEEAITKTKLKRIIKTIDYYLYSHGLNEGKNKIRIDVIAISGNQGNISLNHIKNVGLS
ncbi:MAG: hypothetical protein US62_C0010G0004 [Candidatus Woesebacteria bacterium GW2011_GWA1_37_8]|uniref:UPF0102 protein US62_C0010G0004 n=1 Tax=Candidatus Woesebacteria bacterium GW2011_GWA1_37_8 TaxID=1618546 RepID=A0A0G0K9C1_9BACT|nr:MAG: hypothetical protein US39_C0014G0003 [Microgenomates group bacterium GW2011_GWC1_37_12b]KKQ45719.1 MAG: hypothetical protein US62_C0010G0004 [Candidatus Woesebacteria bacterium GW2011_GWA1_37_8]